MQLENASPLLPMLATAACRSQSMTSLSKLFLLMPSLIVLLRFGKGREGDAVAQPTKSVITVRRIDFMNHPSAEPSALETIAILRELCS